MNSALRRSILAAADSSRLQGFVGRHGMRLGAARFVERLALFGIGASWGGYESLALPTTGFVTRSAGTEAPAGAMVRLHIGLEDTADLIADLTQALDRLGS